MKNINKNTNIIGVNAINNDMYRMLDGYKPSSNSSSKKGSIVSNATSKSTSTSSSTKSSSSSKTVRFTSNSSSSSTRSNTSSSSSGSNRSSNPSSSSRSGSTSTSSRSSNSSSRGGSFSGGGFGGNRYSSSSNTSGSKTDTSQVNAVRFTNNSSSSNRTNSSSHVEAVRFTGNNPVSSKAPLGAEFLNIPVVNVKGGTTGIGSGASSRNTGTISYDLNRDAANREKIVSKASEKNMNTAARGAMTGAFGPIASMKFAKDKAKKENKSIFSTIKNLFGRNKKKQGNIVKTVTSKTVNYNDVISLRNNYSNTPNANKVSTESKIESITGRVSNNNYTEYDVDKLAALIYRETGGSFRNSGEDEEWFAFLNTAAVAMNNQARSGKGDTVGDRICSLSNNVYAGLSDYANTDFDTVTAGATEEQKEKIRNAAKMALSGQYTLPSNMYLQASESIVNRYGNTWNTHNPSSGGIDVHIGYEGNSASNTDLYGNKVPTDVESYRNEAAALRQALESTNDNANNYLNYIDPNDIRQL